MRTIQNILLQDSARLAEALALDAGSARIEVQCLLGVALNATRASLLAHPERSLNTPEQIRYDELLQRRLHGEPIAYLSGEREFFGLPFKVTPATLIPRPDTELLVELALQRIPDTAATADARHYRVLDMGTGSGAIALAIAVARPCAEVLACDISAAALEVAQQNRQRLNIANASFLQSNWFQEFAGQQFDIIVSNPPYIPSADPHLLQGDLRFEPLMALTPGEDGLRDIRLIINQAHVHLYHGGWLLLEHGHDQAISVRELLHQAGFGGVFSARDLAGIERVSGGCRQ